MYDAGMNGLQNVLRTFVSPGAISSANKIGMTW